MLRLPSAVRVFICTLPTDMRRGFDALAAMVKQHFAQDPLCGHLFVFRSRSADRMKILSWDRDGFALWYKRLEKGTFRLPPAVEGAAGIEVTSADLLLLLEGVELSSVRRRPRFAPQKI